MSKEKYSVNNESLTTIDFEVRILGIPVEDLEDLLTPFVTSVGKISKSYYEDFLIANCIANLNQLMARINSLTSITNHEVDLLKLRDELTGLILKHNEALKPENIVINKNQVLKLKTDENLEHSILLTENSFWFKSHYDSEGNYRPVSIDTNHLEKRDPADSAKEVTEVPSSKEKLRDISDLTYESRKIWWDRLREYIVVKQFSMDDVDRILEHKFFHNITTFRTFIVSSCIVDIEEIYEQIDGMGANVDPRQIIKELFALCEGVNPGLNYTRFKDLRDRREEEQEAEDKVSSPVQKVKKTKQGYGATKKKEKTLTFRDVPKADLLNLNTAMKMSLIGQDEAVNKLTESIKRASVGLKDPLRPIGSFLFAGRTGCGKTLATKVLADELIRTSKNRIVIDCSEYTSEHEYAKLIGAPAGYIGHDSGGVLTNAVTENPFSVVVFDEIEKASHKVYDLLLQILDEGRLTDGKGQSVSFKDTIIVMTSNIGVKEIDRVEKTIGFGDVAILTETKKGKALDEALKNKFKPEFLNRIDSVVHFRDLNDDDYMKIIDLELEKLNDNLRNNNTEYSNIKLSFDLRAKKFIFSKGVDEKFGARPIKRAIERYISNEVAGILLEEDVSPNAEIKVSSKKDGITLKVIDKEKEQEAELLSTSEAV